MKVLFLIFHGFEESNGISKKIRYQVKALKDCGADVRTCYLTDENDHKYRMIDETILQDYGIGIKGKIKKRTALRCIVDYVLRENIKLVYIRSDHNTTPFLIYMLWRLKRGKVKILMEIPTYPYDQEYKGLGCGYQRIILSDKLFRRFMARFIDKFVTFSNHEKILGRPTIRIANGIDFNDIPLKKELPQINNELHCIAVATIHPWHGFDRAIRGLAEYYTKGAPAGKVILHIVGQGVPAVIDEYHQLVINNKLESSVIFHGPLFGEELDSLFDSCQLGIGSLARHRSGITHLRSLKNREYAARGIPFIYSETDDDFEKMPFIMKVPADETPINILQVVDFYKATSHKPKEIRSSIEKTLSWKIQMSRVLNNL